jgi:hypothetical protein
VAAVITAAVITAAALATGASASSKSAPPSPWDGQNPFNCTIQDAGFGTKVPHPEADPYCVHFDKTHQNITQLGLVDFLLKEPARVAAAAPKCFYFQVDHWRGSVVQSNGRTVIYEFVGHYFFNKATGDGGAHVTGFSVAGQTFDPSQIPGFPPTYGRYFGPGTGGFITHNDVPTDPRCVAKAKQHPSSVYVSAANRQRCVPDAGHVNSREVGPIALGATEGQVRSQLGRPRSVNRGFLRYCVKKGGALLAGEPGDRSGTFGYDPHTRNVILLTTSHGFVLRGRRGRIVTVGSRATALLRAFPGMHKLATVNGAKLMRSGNLLAGIRRGQVVYLGAYSTRRIKTRRALIGYLRRAST